MLYIWLVHTENNQTYGLPFSPWKRTCSSYSAFPLSAKSYIVVSARDGEHLAIANKSTYLAIVNLWWHLTPNLSMSLFHLTWHVLDLKHTSFSARNGDTLSISLWTNLNIDNERTTTPQSHYISPRVCAMEVWQQVTSSSGFNPMGPTCSHLLFHHLLMPCNIISPCPWALIRSKMPPMGEN